MANPYRLILNICLVGSLVHCAVCSHAKEPAKRVVSRTKTLANGDLYVAQEMVINAPVEKVWAAYTTSEGWKAWVAPVAKVDLRVGGKIKTNYRKNGSVDDDDANTLHVVNYVPHRLLTLQAEVAKDFPDVLIEQEKSLYNVVTFEPLGKNKTKVVSYGVGYRETPELLALLKFFVPANEKLHAKLIEYVEGSSKPKKTP